MKYQVYILTLAVLGVPWGSGWETTLMVIAACIGCVVEIFDKKEK